MGKMAAMYDKYNIKIIVRYAQGMFAKAI